MIWRDRSRGVAYGTDRVRKVNNGLHIFLDKETCAAMSVKADTPVEIYLVRGELRVRKMEEKKPDANA